MVFKVGPMTSSPAAGFGTMNERQIKEQDRHNKMFRNIHIKFLSTVYDSKIFFAFFVSYIRVISSFRIVNR